MLIMDANYFMSSSSDTSLSELDNESRELCGLLLFSELGEEV